MNFIAAKDRLTIELQGREQIWALKSKVEIAKKTIVRIEYKEVFFDWRKWEVRMPGAGVPGKLIAGSFWTEQGWDFLYITNPRGWFNPIVHSVLYIETNQQKFTRIIVSCTKAQFSQIEKWQAN